MFHGNHLFDPGGLGHVIEVVRRLSASVQVGFQPPAFAEFEGESLAPRKAKSSVQSQGGLCCSEPSSRANPEPFAMSAALGEPEV